MIYWAIAVALMWAVYPFLLRKASADFMTLWVWMNAIAAVVGVLVCLATGKPLMLGNMKDVGLVVGASVLGPVLGALLYFWLLKRMDHATPLIALAYTVPVWAAIIGCYVFKEQKISMVQAVGIVMVCMGVVLVAMKEK